MPITLGSLLPVFPGIKCGTPWACPSRRDERLTERDNRSLVERSLTDSVLEMYFLLASLSVRIFRILSSPVSVSAMDSEVGLVALWGP